MGQTEQIIHLDNKKFLPAVTIIFVLAGLGLRLFWIFSGRFSFDSDEAIVGLMARHILQGERPVFFYGQAYMGSLDAWLNAGAFRLFGSSIEVMRCVQLLLWIGLLVTVFVCSRKIFQSAQAGWWAVLMMSLPPVNTVLYSTVSLGGYNEAMIVGVWCIYLAHSCTQNESGHNPWLILGLVSGFGLWVFGFTLLFILPALSYLGMYLWRTRTSIQTWFKKSGLYLIGFCVGAIPIWFFIAANGFAAVISELSGSAVDVQTGPIWQIWFTRLFSYFIIGLPAAFGLRPPWSVAWLMLPLIPFVLIGWIWIFRESQRVARSHHIIYLLVSIPVLLLIVFVFSSFGVDPSGRYFLPIYVVGCLLAAGVLINYQGRYWKHLPVLVLFFLVFQLGGTIQANLISSDGITPQFAPNTATNDHNLVQLRDYLIGKGFRTGYTDYWTAYPLAFLSDDQIILIPRLPYHLDLTYTARDDRYPVYTRLVAQARQNVFLTRQHPVLDLYIRNELSRLGIDWDEDTAIPGYRIFYQFSAPVTPEDLGLGEAVNNDGF